MDRYVVITEYNTTADGKWIPEDQAPAMTVHGPFNSKKTATKYMEDYPDDTDVRDMYTAPLNPVRR